MKIEIDKPVIPQFVADWIDKEKQCTTLHKSFARAISLITHDDDWIKWEDEIGNRWSRIVATAWLYGYEIEEEPLYYAKIKGWEKAASGHFWNYETSFGNLLPSNNTQFEGYHTKMTKTEWNALGINDTNADFEEVR